MHSEAFDPTTFNPTPATNPFRGGRFDSTDGSYSYLYAAESRDVAIAETLLREIPLDDFASRRLVPLAAISDRKISAIEFQHDVELVYLSGKGAAALGQDAWLTKCDSAYFPHTRAWAATIRDWVPSAGGFLWRSRVDDDSLSLILFADRLPADIVTRKGRSQNCMNKSGLTVVRKSLHRYSAALVPSP